MKLSAARLTVVGLGLMGGSLARALRGRCAHLVGVDQHAATLELAQRARAVDRATPRLAEAIEDSDLLILAVPVRAILAILARLGRDLPCPRFVLDLGSTKAQIVAAMELLPSPAEPLGGHPLCGKETSGFAASDGALFRGQRFVLTPLARTTPAALALAQELVDALQARPLIMDAQQHDRLVAVTSHLPYLTAAALVAVASRAAQVEESVWQVAASGFRDTTRLAGSEVTMMLDALTTNRAAVVGALRQVRSSLSRMEAMLEAADPSRLRAELAAIRRQRREFLHQTQPSEAKDGS